MECGAGRCVGHVVRGRVQGTRNSSIHHYISNNWTELGDEAVTLVSDDELSSSVLDEMDRRF